MKTSNNTVCAIGMLSDSKQEARLLKFGRKLSLCCDNLILMNKKEYIILEITSWLVLLSVLARLLFTQ